MAGSTLQVLTCTYLFTISVVTAIVKKSRNLPKGLWKVRQKYLEFRYFLCLPRLMVLLNEEKL